MKAFKNVVKDKRIDLDKQRLSKINEQKEVVLERLLTDRHVKSAYDLNEAERASLKHTLLDLWNPESGLTVKGHKYLFESEIPDLNEKSTSNDIAKWISAAMASNDNMKKAFEGFAGLMTGNTEGYSRIISGLATKIAEMTKKNIHPLEVGKFMIQSIAKELLEKNKALPLQVIKDVKSQDKQETVEL